MMYKITVGSLLALLTCFSFNICYPQKANAYEKQVAAFAESTRDLETSYVSVPVHIGKIDGFGTHIEKRGGFIIIKGIRLYDLVYKEKFTLSNFENFLFSTLVKKESLILQSEQFESLKPFLISEEDASKYMKLKTDSLFKKYTFSEESLFTPSKKEDLPSYESKCILYNFLNHGITVSLDHESGLLKCYKVR